VRVRTWKPRLTPEAAGASLMCSMRETCGMHAGQETGAAASNGP
jgi:hypothetical protein